MNAKPMTVAGIMSGTSADGIDVAVVRIAPGKLRPKLKLLAHEGFVFPAPLRRAVLAAMNATAISTAELARLHWRLGLAYAEAVNTTLKRHATKLFGRKVGVACGKDRFTYREFNERAKDRKRKACYNHLLCPLNLAPP